MFKQGAAVQMAEAYFGHYNENYNGGIGMSNTDWTGTSVAVLKTSELDRAAVIYQMISKSG